MRSAIYVGQVMHRRLRPIRRRFVYKVFSLLIDLDELPEIAAGSKLLAHNRFGLLSVHDRDHGARDGSALKPWVENACAEAGIDIAGGRVRMLCFPRILGYVFNPLTIYFAEESAGRLAAILYQVKNTFGDQHTYLRAVTGDPAPGEAIRQFADKIFHVSPFIEMNCRYGFKLRNPDERLSVIIHETDRDGQDLLVAAQTGDRRPLSDGALFRAWLAHPLMSFKVIAAIHLEALGLWLRGLRYIPRAEPPARDISI